VALGCGSPGPGPAYPTPEDPALEDTEFADVLGLNDEEEALEEDDWVDPSAGTVDPETETETETEPEAPAGEH
jgi:hypothetical protein